MKRFRNIFFNSFGDDRGSLVPIQWDVIPFSPKRIFYVYGTQAGIKRGCHANIKSKFILVAVSGKCKVMCNDGEAEEVIDLDSPTKGVFMENMVWKEMYDFSEDCVLLVISDHNYDKTEYIGNFQEFLSNLKRNVQ